jgi:transposase
MDDKNLYAAILGLKEPCGVEKVELRLADEEVHVWVALPKDTLWVCPECLAAAPIHDHREREWRPLDTGQYRTLVHARVPRVRCPTHGVRQVRVPWAEEKARFTALFEAVAIDWMKQAAIATVAERLRLSWDEAAPIQARAVRRGLARRPATPARHLGIDETSFARRHRYVTVVTDLDRSPGLCVADDRQRESRDACWPQLSAAQLAAVDAVAMEHVGALHPLDPGASAGGGHPDRVRYVPHRPARQRGG